MHMIKPYLETYSVSVASETGRPRSLVLRKQMRALQLSSRVFHVTGCRGAGGVSGSVGSATDVAALGQTDAKFRWASVCLSDGRRLRHSQYPSRTLS